MAQLFGRFQSFQGFGVVWVCRASSIGVNDFGALHVLRPLLSCGDLGIRRFSTKVVSYLVSE